ncbi:MAG: gluconokinase, GntK/IdnK-type [Colwellia sp.]|nr:gluconokinase, GntK/IdnK-type [Colwellia sp.]
MNNSSKIFDENFDKGKQLHLFIIMGVSGSGKSSIGQALAEELNFTFVEADDFHSQQAKEQMANNLALDDKMRKPWVEAIINKLGTLHVNQQHAVLAFSGLKVLHRNLLRNTSYHCHFFYLDGGKETLMNRLITRKNHFFSPSLLDSQFEAMESPLKSEQDISLININNSLADVFNQVITIAQLKFKQD